MSKAKKCSCGSPIDEKSKKVNKRWYCNTCLSTWMTESLPRKSTPNLNPLTSARFNTICHEVTK
jgi:hypothetical protein